jgi:hypothetical protein
MSGFDDNYNPVNPVAECILLHTKWVISLNATGGEYNPTAKYYKDTLARRLTGLTAAAYNNQYSNNYNIYSILKIPLFATFTEENNTRIDKIFFPQQVSIENFFKRFIGDYIKISYENYSEQIKKNKREKQIFPNNNRGVNYNYYDYFIHTRLTLYTILLNEDLRQFYNKYIIYEKLKSDKEFKLYVIPIPKRPPCISNGDSSPNCNNQSTDFSIANSSTPSNPLNDLVGDYLNDILLQDIQGASDIEDIQGIRKVIIDNAYNNASAYTIKKNNLTDSNLPFFTSAEAFEQHTGTDVVAYYENCNHYELVELNQRQQGVTNNTEHVLEQPDNFHSNPFENKDVQTVRTTFKIPSKVVFPKVALPFYDSDAQSDPRNTNTNVTKSNHSKQWTIPIMTIQNQILQSLPIKGGQRTRKLYNARSSSSFQLNNNIQFQSKRNTKRNQTPKPKNSKIKNKKINNKKNKQ